MQEEKSPPSADNSANNALLAKKERLKQTVLIFGMIMVLFAILEIAPIIIDPAKRSKKNVVEMVKKRAPFMLAISIGAAIWIPMRMVKKG